MFRLFERKPKFKIEYDETGRPEVIGAKEQKIIDRATKNAKKYAAGKLKGKNIHGLLEKSKIWV